MAKAYSQDLRDRVIEAVEDEGMSRRGAAVRFGISESSAIKWVQRYRVTGERGPVGTGGHRRSKLKPERDWLLAAIDVGNIRVQAAIDGQGIDLGSLELLTDELASVRLVQPFGTILEAGGYYLTYPAEALNRPRSRLFIDWLLQQAGN